ncbi:MAG: purine-nucleoside phosphorylase [Anaerolineales bacterium]|jgi:purine-nucleoside phosphorylase
MAMQFTLKDYEEAAAVVRPSLSGRPRVGLILGSGLGSLAESVRGPRVIPYSRIPNWPVATVEGHKGQLIAGEFSGQEVIVMQGRAHFYEGYEMPQVAFPVRVLQVLGIEILIVTNAAGAINPTFQPGEVMLITDHLNLIGMGGLTPLRGPNDERLGPRFVDMGQAYDRGLMDEARQEAKSLGIGLREGVYACLAGPSFETPADLRFLRTAGADAVGMSTVPEVVAARHGGTRVLAFSGISNKANLDGSTSTSHEEVLQAGKVISPILQSLLSAILETL